MRHDRIHMLVDRTGTAILVAALIAAAIAVPLAGQPQDRPVPLYDDLGTHAWELGIGDGEARAYFDQGLRLYYAFNHSEAIRSFEEAARRDPGCGLCLWGKALALGPNINAPMEEATGREANRTAGDAITAGAVGTEKSEALLGALRLRYDPVGGSTRAARDTAWAEALGRLADRWPDDVDLQVLRAEALMTLSPWSYWTRDGAPRPDTPEILARLDRALELEPDHPGANHFYIHAIEAVAPERAVPMAERLADLMPGAGHIVHMPGHIYIRVGRYMDAVRANEHAVHADETFIRDQRPGTTMYTAGYYPHNYDFMAFAAAMAGLEDRAIDAADRVAGLVPEEALGTPGLDFLQGHVTRHLQMRVRFERWDEILQAEPPPANLPHARAIWHWARGRAVVGLGLPDSARVQLRELDRLLRDPRLDGMRMEFNPSRTILSIARANLEGWIALEENRGDEAVRAFERAAGLEDGMLYGEPPEWSIPVRHDLGAALLALGRPAEAERAFREDLERFPANGWSLYGLARAMEAQGRHDELRAVNADFRAAWHGTDPTPPMTIVGAGSGTIGGG